MHTPLPTYNNDPPLYPKIGLNPYLEMTHAHYQMNPQDKPYLDYTMPITKMNKVAYKMTQTNPTSQ